MLQTFFVSKTGGSLNFTDGMLNGEGVSFVTMKDKVTGEILKGIEADFVRTRINASNNELLPSTQGFGGFVFFAATGQIKTIENF